MCTRFCCSAFPTEELFQIPSILFRGAAAPLVLMGAGVFAAEACFFQFFPGCLIGDKFRKFGGPDPFVGEFIYQVAPGQLAQARVDPIPDPNFSRGLGALPVEQHCRFAAGGGCTGAGFVEPHRPEPFV